MNEQFQENSGIKQVEHNAHFVWYKYKERREIAAIYTVTSREPEELMSCGVEKESKFLPSYSAQVQTPMGSYHTTIQSDGLIAYKGRFKIGQKVNRDDLFTICQESDRLARQTLEKKLERIKIESHMENDAIEKLERTIRSHRMWQRNYELILEGITFRDKCYRSFQTM